MPCSQLFVVQLLVVSSKIEDNARLAWDYFVRTFQGVQAGAVLFNLELNEAGEITNDKAINELAWREPRKGWGPLEMKV